MCKCIRMWPQTMVKNWTKLRYYTCKVHNLRLSDERIRRKKNTFFFWKWQQHTYTTKPEDKHWNYCANILLFNLFPIILLLFHTILFFIIQKNCFPNFFLFKNFYFSFFRFFFLFFLFAEKNLDRNLFAYDTSCHYSNYFNNQMNGNKPRMSEQKREKKKKER